MPHRDSDDRPADPGQWIRRQRELRGISSQAELARRLGWDKATVNNYETRGVQISDERAEQLAEAFGVDIITARRGLGLWTPPDTDLEEPAGDDPAARIAHLRREADRLEREAMRLEREADLADKGKAPQPDLGYAFELMQRAQEIIQRHQKKSG